MQDKTYKRENILELKNVEVHAQEHIILDKTNISFPSHKISVILGTAGSGKSTLLKVAAALIPPLPETIFYKGKDIEKMNAKEELDFRASTGFIFQDSALWSDTSIYDNVCMPLRVHKPWMTPSEIDVKVHSLMKQFGFTDSVKLRPADISIGEQKLISIARGIIHDPALIFMDDPTSSLDSRAKKCLFSVLGDLKKAEKTVIIATSHQEIPYRFADYLGVLKDSQLVTFGRYDEVEDEVESVMNMSLYRGEQEILGIEEDNEI